MSIRGIRNISMLVDNEFGVLTRITALVRRDGLNIKSLAVTETKDKAVSRLLIAVECTDNSFIKVLARLKKLGCIKSAEGVSESFDLSGGLNALFSELENSEEQG
ncbi:MAG: ACT domain-containing protein [Clostridiales bacterium]|jgi:acetolactate synthase-1/3 small subunit|nr:ACT domain-containing protein [Clostridiales bacterium]